MSEFDPGDEFEIFMRFVWPLLPEHNLQYRSCRRAWFAGMHALMLHLGTIFSSHAGPEAILRNISNIEEKIREFNDIACADDD